jgi:hypothetical protein
MEFFLCKGSPWEDEGILVLIFRFYLNLVVAREPIHEREDLTIGTIIYDLVNEWCWVVVFWTSLIQISEFGTCSYGALFFINWN